MPSVKVLNNSDVLSLAESAARRIRDLDLMGRCAYPIPRGGVPAAYAIRNFVQFHIVDSPKDADFVIDDLIDSGATIQRYSKLPAVTLFDKRVLEEEHRYWMVFPWETTEAAPAADSVIRLLEYIGENPKRGGLVETPKRVIKAWEHWASGYRKDPADVLKCFEDGGQDYDEMVVVKEIPFYSQCEHHMAPFFGTATIAYIPKGRIVGLSKLSRLLDIYARRLQVQERLTGQVADALHEHLKPKGVGVVIKARHLCMESRGICKQGHETVTSALRGVIKELPEARAEFLSFVQ